MMCLTELYAFLPLPLLNRLAVEYAVDAHNQVRLPGSAVLLCLLHGLLRHPELTQRLLEETYREKTGQSVDHSSFGKRLSTIPAEYFAAVFEHVYQKSRDHLPADRTTHTEILRLRRVDATAVTLSAKLLSFGLVSRHYTKKKAAKEAPALPEIREKRQVKAVFELDNDNLPLLLHVCKDQSEASDNRALGESMVQDAHENDLFVFDKGVHDRDRLLLLHRKGAFFLTPRHQQTFRTLRVLYEPAPQALCSEAPKPGEADFRLVRVEEALFQNGHEGARFTQMPLVVLYGERFDRRTRQWKAMVLLTNLPVPDTGDKAGPYTFLELAELYRSRWDIELFFRFLKSRLGYRHLLSRNENGITVMIYVTLIAALLLLWYKAKTRIDRGWRSVQFWLETDLQTWTKEALSDALSPPQQPNSL